MTVTIYHNPRCSKSRQTLQLLEDNAIEARVIEYLRQGPDAATLKKILKQLGMSARELLRKGESVYKENNLKDQDLTDDELINFMVEYPILIERPIVIANGQARIGRPPESVLEIL